MSESEVKTGSCQCGAVTFRVAGPFRDLIMCHCDMCQKSSGHHIAATAAEDSAFTFIKDDGLTWYRSSDHAKRGFCSKCGSNLLWKMDGRDNTSIFVGCLEEDIDLPVPCMSLPVRRKVITLLRMMLLNISGIPAHQSNFLLSVFNPFPVEDIQSACDNDQGAQNSIVVRQISKNDISEYGGPYQLGIGEGGCG